MNKLYLYSIFFVFLLVIKQEVKASYILPEFSIETKDDLSNSRIEITLFKTRSQSFRRDEVVKVLNDEEKAKFAAILNASRYGRNDAMYLDGPILNEYEEVGFLDIINSSGISSKYWLKVTENLKNWSLIMNKEAFSSSVAAQYFDESKAIADFLDFQRVENLNYLHVPFFRWIFYSILAVVVIVAIRKRIRNKPNHATRQKIRPD